MPELGEVAHATALLRKYILGKTLLKTTANADNLLFVSPLTNDSFVKSTEGAEITQISRNGKYFMVELAKSRTLVMHFGMTGWIHVKNVGSLIRMEGGGDKKQKSMMESLVKEGKDPATASELVKDWPPRFTKFTLTTDAGDDLAFVDPRRLARVRLFDCPVSRVNELEPLCKLGTDFSQHQPPAEDIIPLILKRKVPVKALLLDQSVFSGIGNWMADEILYQARLHPEQYANTLTQDRALNLYNALLEVSKIAAETEGNSANFPKHWLMLHRWGKARSKKEIQKTAEGHIVGFITVGGRTSCYVPDLQKKFRPVKEEEEALSSKRVKRESKVKEENKEDNKVKEENKEESEVNSDKLDE